MQMNITPDFVSTYLFKKLLPISLPFYNPALIFTKAMYFKVTPNHRQVSRAWMVWDMVGGDTNHGMGGRCTKNRKLSLIRE
jgi:hypothetical protein